MMPFPTFIPAAVAMVSAAVWVLPALGETDPGDLSGSIVATVDGKEIQLPLLKADYTVSVDGDAAHVELTQTFLNPTDRPLHATYLFPLNSKAAIHAMRLDMDGETVVARIRRKADAETIFEKAKEDGKAAALLTQHRPNMFTQDIAHLMPGRPVRVTLEYVQNVPKIDGSYELVVPMVVGPRYERAQALYPLPVSHGDALPRERVPESVLDELASSGPQETVSGWHIDRLPAYPPVTGLNAPADIDPERVSLDLTLTAPVPVNALWSDTHALDIADEADRKTVRFADGRAVDNRDFVLRYQLAAEADVAAGISSRFDENRGGHLSLLIEPPQLPAEDMAGQRELVFVLDTSGSMSGEPLAASKTFMAAAIRGLRPDDYFRILRFSDNSSVFASEAVLASEQNRARALRFVNDLEANGGTEMDRAINAAFDQRQPENTTRIVVFLTDGYIGDERNVISSISSRIGDARIFAFGVGGAVNRFLLEAVAREGRGYVRYVGLDEDAREVAAGLAASLKTPLLTDISIDWNGLDVEDQTPARIPDLFEGGSVRVLARYRTGGKHTVYVSGQVNGRAARLPLEIDLAGAGEPAGDASKALPLLWARERIFDINRAYTIGGSTDTRLENEITELGLAYSLQSRFTSFVAVSERKVNPDPASATSADVPLPQVSGVSARAYPSLNLSGSSAPEPEGLFGVMMVILGVAARFRSRLLGLFRELFRAFRRKGRRLVRRTASDTVSVGKLDRRLPRALRRDSWWLET
ncbi:MAG: VIT domain-containing protein [Roseibium sp.]